MSRDFLSCLNEARARFPQKPGFPDISLVISHKLRKRINQSQNKATKPIDACYIESNDGPMYLHKGLRLQGHLQEKARGVCNAAFYTILELHDKTIKVICEASQQEIELPITFVQKHMRLGYAITQASCQSLSCKGRVRIYNSDHMFFTKNHLYVTVSRATAASLVEVI